MGVDVLLAPAEKTGVGNAVRTAKHKQNETNDNLSSLCHGRPEAIMSAIPELSAADKTEEMGDRNSFCSSNLWQSAQPERTLTVQ